MYIIGNVFKRLGKIIIIKLSILERILSQNAAALLLMWSIYAIDPRLGRGVERKMKG